MKPIVYLQSGFWESLSAENSRECKRTMLDVSDAMGDSCVITDATEEQILRDEFLKIIIKQKTYQRCNNDFVDKIINNLNLPCNTENLCATYLLDKSVSECQNIEKKYGVLALNAKNATDRRYLFKGDGFSLDKAIRYNLRYLTFKEKLSQPCNSLIIIDPYLLIKREISGDGEIYYPGISNNLESLLDTILPQELEVDFNLTIISCLDKPDEVKRVYEKIKKCLKRIRKGLSVKLGLFYTGKGYFHKIESFHSRHIISNTFAVDSEDGLDLFNNNGYITKNNPVVSIVFPRLFGDSRQDITKYCKWIASVKKYINNEVDKLYEGSKENRLFDLVE